MTLVIVYVVLLILQFIPNLFWKYWNKKLDEDLKVLKKHNKLLDEHKELLKEHNRILSVCDTYFKVGAVSLGAVDNLLRFCGGGEVRVFLFDVNWIVRINQKLNHVEIIMAESSDNMGIPIDDFLN